MSPQSEENVQIKNWQVNVAKEGRQITFFSWKMISAERNIKSNAERMTAATTNISLVIYHLKNTSTYANILETMENRGKIENIMKSSFIKDKSV